MSGYANLTNRLLYIYETLLSRYGNLQWWPAKTPYEVIVGAVLTQNTAWHNVEKAIAGFGNRLTPDFIENTGAAELAEIIRPAGYFNQKAGYLKAVTAWYKNYDYDVSNAARAPFERLRNELLAVKGVGPETADSILLYAFGFPTFVVDTYTYRLCGRYPVDAGNGYAAVKAYFEGTLPKDADIYNNFHAMIVINGKDYCRTKPACSGCPLLGQCGFSVTSHRVLLCNGSAAISTAISMEPLDL